jgi:hypothetical protein
MLQETDNYTIFKSDEGYHVGRLLIMTAPIHRRVSKKYETKEQALKKLKKIIIK